MTALIPAKHGTIHRTACGFHEMVSELSSHSLSWGVIGRQASPVSIMQCRWSYHICVNFVFFLAMLCVSRLACDQCAVSVMHEWTLNSTHLVHETVYVSWTLDIDGRLRRTDSSHKNAEYISIYLLSAFLTQAYPCLRKTIMRKWESESTDCATRWWSEACKMSCQCEWHTHILQRKRANLPCSQWLVQLIMAMSQN